MLLKKQDIQYLPFAELSAYNDIKEFDKALQAFHLSRYDSWMLPQILAFWGQCKVVRNKQGLVDPLAFLKANVGSDQFRVGLWRASALINRGSLVTKQSDPKLSRYGGLTPLILAGVKEHQGVNYSEWDSVGLEYVVGDKLHKAMTYSPPDLSRDRLLEIRDIGLTTKSGKTEGEKKKATSVWALTGLGPTELADAPTFATTMLCQTWIAHPSLRHKYMVLDPVNWDNIPEPLIDTDILPDPKSKKVVEYELPWMAI